MTTESSRRRTCWTLIVIVFCWVGMLAAVIWPFVR